jgi:hypothetical protein
MSKIVSQVSLFHDCLMIKVIRTLHRRDHEMPIIGALWHKNDISHRHIKHAIQNFSAPYGM